MNCEYYFAKNQMLTMQQQVTDLRNELQRAESALATLDHSRVHCEHDWDSGIKGYEYEGKHCTKCGINNMYADTLKKHLERVAKTSA